MKKLLYLGMCMYFIVGSGFADTPAKQNKTHTQVEFKRKLLEQYYLNSLPNKDNAEIRYTPLYKKALEYYGNPAKFDQKEVKKFKYKIFNKEKVKDLLLKSYLNENNQMALTSLVYLYNQFEAKSDLKIQAEYLKIVTELAKNGNCLGILENAKFFKYGLGDITKNEKEAYRFLKIGEARCKKSYMYSAINTELYSLRKKFETKKGAQKNAKKV